MSAAFWTSYVLLWILVVVLSVAVFALYHHFGQMYLNSREGRASAGPSMDQPWTRADFADVSGNQVALPLAQTPFVAVFTSTTCPICVRMGESFAQFVREWPRVQLVIFCEGSRAQVLAWAGSLADEATVVADEKGRIATRFQVGGTPFGVGVDSAGTVRARGIVNDTAGLSALAESAVALNVIVGSHEGADR